MTVCVNVTNAVVSTLVLCVFLHEDEPGCEAHFIFMYIYKQSPSNKHIEYQFLSWPMLFKLIVTKTETPFKQKPTVTIRLEFYLVSVLKVKI